MRQRSILCLIAALCIIGTAFAQGVRSDFPNYGSGFRPYTATAGTQGGAAGAYWNPAAWGAMDEWEASFSWDDRNIARHHVDNWGLSIGGEGIGFTVQRNDMLLGGDHYNVTDYQLGCGFGDREQYWGLSYGWSNGDKHVIDRDQILTAGGVYRPLRYLSVGGAASYGLVWHDYRGVADIGVRPLGTHHLTVFGDLAAAQFDNPTTMQWGAGVEVMPLNGVRIAGKVQKLDPLSQDKVFSVSLGLAINGLGFSAVPHYDKDNNRLSTSYVARMGEQFPALDLRPLTNRNSKTVVAGLKGNVSYQKARWFDQNRMALLGMVEDIDEAKKDPTVKAMALNLSGFSPGRESAWELREKLIDFKSSGKKVYVYADRMGMTEYYFASVADYVWMDPAGNLMIPGYVAGRTYLRNLMSKLGLGVDEWRFFTYKSAFESLSRDNMSEPDKEQRLAMITDFYGAWLHGVTTARAMTTDRLRVPMDSLVILNPEEAFAMGLVDTVAAWSDAKDLIELQDGEKPDFIERDEVEAEIFPDASWGRLPEIALVYAVGECDMDSGIRGRYTSRLLRKLSTQKHVKAVVLRADSPGGDALPSDLVAREMKEVSKKKPMIVSQGGVAASGGYWISMNGDRIFTSPFTLTGSIGVIGGWIYNDGFSSRTGLTHDRVQVGEHADLLTGIQVPLIGAQIPNRPLTAVERARMEHLIRAWYRTFVQKVADARGLDSVYVDSVAQGRVWAGERALQLKLVDEIGTMETAIRYAKEQAKISPSRKVKIVEFPRAGWFNPDMFRSPSPVQAIARWIGLPAQSSDPGDDYELRVLQRMADRPGEALLMLPPEDLPLE